MCYTTLKRNLLPKYRNIIRVLKGVARSWTQVSESPVKISPPVTLGISEGTNINIKLIDSYIEICEPKSEDGRKENTKCIDTSKPHIINRRPNCNINTLIRCLKFKDVNPLTNHHKVLRLIVEGLNKSKLIINIVSQIRL